MITTFIQLGVRTYKLLPKALRREAITNISGSLLQALLEVISLSAVVPLLINVVSNKGGNDVAGMLNMPFSFGWPGLVSVVLIVFLMKNGISIWLTHCQAQYAHRVFIEMSERLYTEFYNQSWVEYLKGNSADSVRKIKHMPSDFTTYILQGFLMVITDLAICIFIGCILAWYDYKIILVLLLLSAPIVGIYLLYRKRILSKISSTFREATPKANIVLTQGIDSYAEGKIYNKESFFVKRFMTLNNLTSNYLASLKVVTTFPSRLFELMGIVLICAVITYYQNYSAASNSISFYIGLLLLALYRIVPSLNRVLVNLTQIEAYSHAVGELEFELNKKNSEYDIPTSHAINFGESIHLHDVSFRYGSKSQSLFENLSFSIKKGEFILLEGSSGSGKTTLLHILSGLITDYSGEIKIDNTVLTKATCRSWQGTLGIVPQSPVVLQESLLHNVTFGEDENNIDFDKVTKSLSQAGLSDFVSSLSEGINSSVSENGLTLSGGQRQRLILARALYRNPSVLLLDEVTNQLDEVNKEKVLSTLKSLTEEGITIIVSSHDPVVRRYANRIFRLQNKSIVEL